MTEEEKDKKQEVPKEETKPEEPKPTEKPEEKKEKQKIPEDVVFIGKDRSITEYGAVVIRKFFDGINVVKLQSRGRINSKTLDLSQYIVRNLGKNEKIDITNIIVGTELLPGKRKDVEIPVTTLTVQVTRQVKK